MPPSTSAARKTCARSKSALAVHDAGEQHDFIREREKIVPVFYINRESDALRRRSIETELRLAGITAERVCAVNGLDLPEPLLAYFGSDPARSSLRPGEVGCYASHLKVARLIVDQKLPCALVLEDDARLSKDFVACVKSVLAAVPADWDIVHLCRDPSHAIKPLARVHQNHMLVRYSRVPAQTVAYLISETGARKFLKPFKRRWPVDTDFRQPWKFGFQIYGLVPRIAWDDKSLPSAMRTHPAVVGHARSRRRRGIPVPSWDCPTGNPLHTPQGFYFNIRTLGVFWWIRCFVYNALMRLGRWLGIQLIRGRGVGAEEAPTRGAPIGKP